MSAAGRIAGEVFSRDRRSSTDEDTQTGRHQVRVQLPGLCLNSNFSHSASTSRLRRSFIGRCLAFRHST